MLFPVVGAEARLGQLARNAVYSATRSEYAVSGRRTGSNSALIYRFTL